MALRAPKTSTPPAKAPVSRFLSARSRSLQRACACGGSSGLDGKCEECRQNEMGLQRLAAASAASNVAPPIVHDVVRSPGQPLDRATRASLEPRFGHDFSRVRIHADAKAAESARAVAAHAYTVGGDIVFGAGRYAPGMESGRRLLAHELAHTIQQEAALGPDRSSAELVQRDDDGSNAVNPDQEYQAAVQSGDWQAAAEWLNGFNRVDIQARLAKLSQDQVTSLHQGALDNPRVGPQSQIAQLTEPGTPLASTPPPAASTPPPPAEATPPASPPAAAPGVDTGPAAAVPAQAQQGPDPNSIAYKQGYDDAKNGRPSQPAAVLNEDAIADYNAGYAEGNALGQSVAPAPPTDASRPAAQPDSQAGAAIDVSAMSTPDKLEKAYEYADIGTALRSQLNQRFGPKQLVIMIAAGIGVFIVAQFTPVGWIADIGMVLTAAFVGKALSDAFHHLAGFAAAADATTDAQLHQAGDEFAAAVAGLEIDTILLVLTLLSGGAGGAAGRAASSASAPAGELALLGADGFVVGTIPAAEAAATTTAITAAQAAQLGLKGAALANAMMSQGAGPQTTSESAEELGRSGGGTSPQEAATVGTEIEPIEVQDWAAELDAEGFQTYPRNQFGQGQIGGRRLSSMFTDARARPDLIAVSEADKTAIVGDVTGNPGSTAKIPGQIGQEEGLHIEKTIEYARQLKRQLGEGYRVFAQDRHWQTGTKTNRIEVE